MRFKTDKHEELFRTLVFASNTDSFESPDEVKTSQLVEVYLKGRNGGDYQRRIKGMKKSQAAKLGHRRHRASYEMGIRKYQRNVATGIHSVKYAASRLKRKAKDLKIRKTGSDPAMKEAIEQPFKEYEIYEFLRALNTIKVGVLKEATFFDLEEQHIEYALFAEVCCKALAKIEFSLLENEPIMEEDFEVLLILVGSHIFNEQEFSDMNRSLTEIFMEKDFTEDEEDEPTESEPSA